MITDLLFRLTTLLFKKNRIDCGFDLGDCCMGTEEDRRSKGGCIECKCYEKTVCNAGFWGDGICDTENNIWQCGYDGGDCCKEWVHKAGNPFKKVGLIKKESVNYEHCTK